MFLYYPLDLRMVQLPQKMLKYGYMPDAPQYSMPHRITSRFLINLPSQINQIISHFLLVWLYFEILVLKTLPMFKFNLTYACI